MAWPRFTSLDNDGNPAVGFYVYTYAAGTATPLATYSDAGLSVLNTNPVILDSLGSADIHLQDVAYKFVLKNTTNGTIWTRDGLTSAAITT